MDTKTVIILHGWNVPPERYERLSNYLKNYGYKTYTPDFPGVGSTPVPNRPYSLDDYVGFLEKYINNKKIKQFIIIGHSFGGRVGIRYASRHPEQVERLFLTGTPGLVPVGSGKIKLFLIISKIGKTIFSLPILSTISSPVRKVFHKLSGAADYTHLKGVMQETFKLIIRDSLVKDMELIKVPTKLIWGERDALVPVSIARQMQRIIKGSKLIVVPGATHKLPYDDIHRFITALNIA